MIARLGAAATLPSEPDPVAGGLISSGQVDINPTFFDQAAKEFCVYSSGDSENRGGQACSTADEETALTAVADVDANDFSEEFFSWDWGTGCSDISDTAGTAYTGAVATSAAAGAANFLLPGFGSAVSAVGNLITDLINHGAIIHNQENEILCAVVPRLADTLGAIVAAFRAGNLTAAQAVSLLDQTQSATLQALGSEAGRGSGQGVLRNLAVVVGYYSLELPAEEAARKAAAPSSGAGASSSSASAAGSVSATPSTDWFMQQLVAGLPNWTLLVAGAVLLSAWVL